MTLVKFNNPKSPMQTFNDYIDDFFGRDVAPFVSKTFGYNPPVNVKESDSSFVIEMAAPGKDKNDFNLELNENMLTISSETENKTEEKNEKFTRREFSHSSFSRTFTLPDNVNQSMIEASYENGILKVNLPKKEVAKTKVAPKIKVK